MDGKKCNACGEFKPLDAFYRNARRKDGLSGKCRECEGEYRRAWYHANPDRWRVYRRRDYMRNGEKRRASKREYYLAHRDAMLEYQKRYREENRETYRTYQRLYARIRSQKRKAAGQ